MALERYDFPQSDDQNLPRNAGGRRFGQPRPTSIIERIPPHNIEAEQAVLGAMLMGSQTAVERGIEMLEATDFYRDAHSTIFESMADLSGKGEPIDIVTLKDDLARRGILEAVGGIRYVMTLNEMLPTASNIAYYAKIVREKAILRRLIEAAGEISGMAFGEVDEVDTIVDRAERAIFDVSSQRDSQNLMPLKPLLHEAFERIDTLYREKGGLTGVDTGLTDLNEMTSGLQDGDLIIIAARPSMGKSALALNIGQNAALIGAKHVAVFSLEMSKEQLVQRMICSEARVNAHRLRTGYLTSDDWDRLSVAVNNLWDASLYIDDTTDISSLEIRAKCRRLRAEYGLDMVIIDYLQLIRAGSKGGRSNANRNDEITEIARSLKSLARELKVPVIALSQLSRSVERREDKRPMLSDLRDSGSIEAEADVVGFIYRPAYYERKQQFQAGSDNAEETPAEESAMAIDAYGGEEAEIIISKQRNGPTGTIKLAFLSKYARFENLALHREESVF